MSGGAVLLFLLSAEDIEMVGCPQAGAGEEVKDLWAEAPTARHSQAFVNKVNILSIRFILLWRDRYGTKLSMFIIVFELK